MIFLSFILILNNYRSQNRTIKILSNQKNQKRQKQKKMIIVLKQNLSTEKIGKGGECKIFDDFARASVEISKRKVLLGKLQE